MFQQALASAAGRSSPTQGEFAAYFALTERFNSLYCLDLTNPHGFTDREAYLLKYLKIAKTKLRYLKLNHLDVDPTPILMGLKPFRDDIEVVEAQYFRPGKGEIYSLLTKIREHVPNVECINVASVLDVLSVQDARTFFLKDLKHVLRWFDCKYFVEEGEKEKWRELLQCEALKGMSVGPTLLTLFPWNHPFVLTRPHSRMHHYNL